MAKRIYYLPTSNPTAEITCEVAMKSQAYNTSTAKLKRSSSSVTIARSGENGEEVGSGSINQVAIGAAQDIQGAKLIFAHSLDLGYCTDEDWMLILRASTKDEYEDKREEYMGFVKEEKWEEVFEILRLSIFYSFDGGLDGFQRFEFDYDDVFDHSDDGLVIVIAKAVQLIYT